MNKPCKIFYSLPMYLLRKIIATIAMVAIIILLIFPALVIMLVTVGTVRLMDCIEKKILDPIFYWAWPEERQFLDGWRG
ncbi:hypothetical protein E4H12_01905 [Candidatus Thorarchaeota archaeon]|nr:MAG: hypothetical protein E4H12_01905 [Candidatus Thorarchaeota archaeon]